MILISACLLGRNVKYNGGNNLTGWLAEVYDPKYFLAVCPEVLAGFAIPRPPVEIQSDGSIHNKLGLDITRGFLREVPLMQELVRKHRVRYAILKERSPSCGVAQIYNGSFSGVRISGQGIGTSALLQAGVTCYSEETLSREVLQRLLAEEQAMDQGAGR